jgi:multicomponent Na+:H+ antiporter subunit F
VTGMTPFFEFLLFALAIIVFVYLYRVVKGPTVFDRVLGLNGIATKAIIMLVAVGTVYQRVEMFVDISTGYALLNMVSALAVAKYLEGRGRA